MGDDVIPPPPEFADSMEYADMGDVIPPPLEFADFPERTDSMHDSPVPNTTGTIVSDPAMVENDGPPTTSAAAQRTIDPGVPGLLHPTQPPHKDPKVASASSQSSRPSDLTVEVQLNGKSPGFLSILEQPYR